MKHYCGICNQEFTRSNTLKDHYDTPKHLTNQAIYDGQLKVVYEKEKEEWEIQKAKLLFDNKSLNEGLINISEVNFKHIAEVAVLKARLALYDSNTQIEYQNEYNKSQKECREKDAIIERFTEKINELQQELKREDRDKGKEVIERFNDKLKKYEEEWAVKEKELKTEISQLKRKIRNFDIEMDTIRNSNRELQEQLDAFIPERLTALENAIIDC